MKGAGWKNIPSEVNTVVPFFAETRIILEQMIELQFLTLGLSHDADDCHMNPRSSISTTDDISKQG